MRPTNPADMPVMVMTRRIKGYRRSQPRLYDSMVQEFTDMSSGGSGGPYQYGLKWITVREAYFNNWTDDMFTQVLHNLGED